MMWTLSCHLFFFEWIVLNTFISVHTYTSTAGTFAKSYPPKPVWTKDFDLILWSNLFCKVVTRGKTEEAARSNERKEKQEHMRLQNDVLMYLADVFTCVPRQEFGVLDLRDCVKAVWGRLIMNATCGYFLFSQLYVGFHQDYHIFSRGDPNLNLQLPLASWEGGTTDLICCSYILFPIWRSKNPRFSTTFLLTFQGSAWIEHRPAGWGQTKKNTKKPSALARWKKKPNEGAAPPLRRATGVAGICFAAATTSTCHAFAGGECQDGDMKKTEFDIWTTFGACEKKYNDV